MLREDGPIETDLADAFCNQFEDRGSICIKVAVPSSAYCSLHQTANNAFTLLSHSFYPVTLFLFNFQQINHYPNLGQTDKMQITIQIIAVAAALVSTAAAAPAVNTSPNPLSRRDLIVLPGNTDQGQTTPAEKRSPVSMKKRGATDTYGDYTGQWSSYSDGSGTYVRTDDVHRYGSGDKCWTDLFYVSSSNKQTDWKREGSIDCGSTSECEAGIDKGVETCNEWSISIEVGVEANIIKDVLSASASVTTTYGESKCESVTTKSTCKWQDTACHAIWSSQTVKVDHGYIRRRCDFHDGKGDQTVWSKDWDLSQKADELHLGCKADCSAGTYPA